MGDEQESAVWIRGKQTLEEFALGGFIERATYFIQ